MYPIIKYIHIILVVTSVALFQLRFWRKKLDTKFYRVLPHIIDTLLLISGISLAWLVGFSPMNSSWLLFKLVAVVMYILFGAMAMRSDGVIKWITYFAATLTVVYILLVANLKTPWPLP